MTKRFMVSDWLLMVAILFSAIYNADNTYVRLIIILSLFVMPLLIFIKKTKSNSAVKTNSIVKVSIIWLFYIIFWAVRNLNEINLNFDGPNVEMLTPILFITALYAFPLISRYNKDRLRLVTMRFLIFYVAFLLIDMIWRYVQEPNCFLNYSCRYDAKTVGYFTTTNALASSLAVVLISLEISALKLKTIKLILFIVLITSMARAAIISFVLVYMFIKFKTASKMIRFFIIIASSYMIYLLFLYDPLEFKTDGSALSKIMFFESSYFLVNTSSIDKILFGFGANFETITTVLGINDWSPHAPILKAFLYFGLFGVFLHILYLLSVIKLERYMFYPVLAFIVLGFAGAPLYFPTFLASFAILRISNANEN